MTVYRDLTADEQRLLRRSLAAAGVFVSAASPGRKEEIASEGFAVAKLILESEAEYVAYPLIVSTIIALRQQVNADERFPDYVEVATQPGARDQAVDTLREAMAMVDAKASPEEAGAFRAWLMRMAWEAAVAGKEDQGFLGMGGVQINDAERAALRELAALLGVDPPPEARELTSS